MDFTGNFHFYDAYKQDELISGSNCLSSLKQSTRIELYKRLSAVRDYIETSFTDKIELKELSALSSLSENHLVRHFKEAFDITPHQYIVRKRLALARQLLADTNEPVSVIVFKCGFEDHSSFGRLFKSRYKITPAKFRLKKV